MRDIITTDGLARYYPSIFLEEKCFQKLQQETQWQQDSITMYGKTHPIPRLQAFIGNSGITYSYSGLHLNTQNWTPTTLSIKYQLEAMFNCQFNSALCNFYRHGKDYVSWHSDDEKELGHNPTIASVSFGQERVIEFKHRYDKSLEKVRLNLENGSVLLMSGSLQHQWQHQIIKTAKSIESRVNLTYRLII